MHAHLLAGDCTMTFEGNRSFEKEGRVVCLRKPDDTLLVHDADGYRPVAWLTRPDTSMAVGTPPTVEARDGDDRLSVQFHETSVDVRVPVSPAGTPVGDCPTCSGRLVEQSGTIACTDCDTEHGLPAGATVLDSVCECGLPRIEVTRGVTVEVCTDRACDPLDAALRERLDGAFTCPDCGDSLRVVRAGGLLLGCDSYPSCDMSVPLPDDVCDGTCDCGLPTVNGECLAGTCPSP